MSANKKYLKRLSDYDVIPATDYLIEPHVPLGALIFVAGLPKTFKTFLSGIDWGYSVATGCQWLGRPTRKGRVLYFALEGYHGVLRRAEAWRVFHEKSKADGDDLAYAQERISFAEKTCSADQHFTTLQSTGFRPDLVIIDTWFKVTAGAEVGGQPDMSVALKNLRDFQNRLTEWKVEGGLPAVTFVVIAHTDKKGQALFGSITQFADADVLYQLERVEHAAQATLECIDTRDIEEPPAITFEMHKVSIVTRKGEEQNLVVSKEVVAAAGKSSKGSKKDDDLQDMIDVLSTICRNKATRTEWLAAMQNFGRGWSEANFDKKLGLLKKAGRVSGGGAQGEYYFVDTTGTGEGEGNDRAKEPSTNYPQPHSLKGNEGCEGSFGCPEQPSNHPHEGNDGSSRSNGNGQDSVAPKPFATVNGSADDDLLRQGMASAAKLRGRAQ